VARKGRAGAGLTRAGLLLLLSALLLSGYNLLDDRRAGDAAEAALRKLPAPAPAAAPEAPQSPTAPQAPANPAETEIPDYVLDPERELPTQDVDGSSYVGRLDLPALDLSLPVLEEWSYPNLRLAPCRYAGTAYASGFVLAGHNYSRHFGRLDRLCAGDAVTFTDVEGNAFPYRVAEVQILRPTDTEAMLSPEWDLTLFTCTPGGRTRLAVRCVRDAP
jgi:sortase A